MSPSALWLEGARLAALLGDSVSGPPVRQALAQQPLMGVRMDLTPGDVLHVHGSVSHYAYVLECGLVQCHDPGSGLGLPVSVRFAGMHDWIGLCDLAGRHQQTVRAVAHATVLAFSAAELRAMCRSSPPMAEMLARRVDRALAREVQVLHRQSGRSCHDRLVAGLVHLVALSGSVGERTAPPQMLRVLLERVTLAGWLGMPLPSLHRCLEPLRLAGALKHDEEVVHELNPRILLATCASEFDALQTGGAGPR